MGEFVAKMTGEGNGTLRTPSGKREEGSLDGAPERIHQTRKIGTCVLADKLFSQRFTSPLAVNTSWNTD